MLGARKALTRRTAWRIWLLGLAALIGGCLLVPRAEGPAALAPAPDFALQSHTGERVSLSGLVAEQPTVLVFYRGYW